MTPLLIDATKYDRQMVLPALYRQLGPAGLTYSNCALSFQGHTIMPVVQYPTLEDVPVS